MTRFDAYCARKEAVAASTSIAGFVTVCDEHPAEMRAVGSAWTQQLFDGDFYVTPAHKTDVPSVSLVFVQSRAGNTVVDDPSTLGGGETDKHLIYEGLSRLDADAVMAGASTAGAGDLVFSIWHPELVRLRRERGHSRHPAQVVVTGRGGVNIETALWCQEPALPVYLVTRSQTAPGLRARTASRPWITVIDAGEPLSMRRAMRALRERGLGIISCVGGRRTATALLQEGLVDDIYLTTSPLEGGMPDTPFYLGRPPVTRLIVEKRGRGPEADVRFEHRAVNDYAVNSSSLG